MQLQNYIIVAFAKMDKKREKPIYSAKQKPKVIIQSGEQSVADGQKRVSQRRRKVIISSRRLLALAGETDAHRDKGVRTAGVDFELR